MTEHQKKGMKQTSRKDDSNYTSVKKQCRKNTSVGPNYEPLSKNLNNRVTVTDITVI